MHPRLLALPLLLLATSGSGQAQNITQGGTRWGFTGSATTCSDAGALADFTATGTDTLYQHFWSLCINGGTVCRLSNPAVNAIPVPGYANLLRRTYPNWQGSGLDVEVLVTVSDFGGRGMAVNRIHLVNNSGGLAIVNLYAYADVDFYGSTNNSALGTQTATGRVHHITNSSSATDFLEYYGHGADGDAAAAFAGLRGIVTTTCADFTTAPFSPGGSFGPGDYTGAFHWKDRVIGPGGSLDAWVALGHNMSPRPCPPASAGPYGAPSGSANGILLASAPIVGNGVTLSIGAGPTAVNQPLTLYFGLTPISVPVAGLTVLTTFDLFSISGVLDANASAQVPLPIPYLPLLCGGRFQAQAFYLDPGSPAAVPVSATNAITFTFGS